MCHSHSLVTGPMAANPLATLAIAVFLICLLLPTSSSSSSICVARTQDHVRTAFHFQPAKNWQNGNFQISLAWYELLVQAQIDFSEPSLNTPVEPLLWLGQFMAVTTRAYRSEWCVFFFCCSPVTSWLCFLVGSLHYMVAKAWLTDNRARVLQRHVPPVLPV
jgi:hypothetical protein